MPKITLLAEGGEGSHHPSNRSKEAIFMLTTVLAAAALFALAIPGLAVDPSD